MADLVRIDLELLPSERAFRPVSRQAWYGRALLLAVGAGVVVAIGGSQLSMATAWIAGIALAGGLGARQRRMLRLGRDNDDAVALLGAGELEEAARILDRLCAEARWTPHLHSLFVYNRGVVHLERGELERAIGLFSAVVHAGWIARREPLSAYYPKVLGGLATAEALRGRVETAQGWRVRAHAAISGPQRGSLLPVDVVVEARAGRPDEVMALVAEGWRRAEHLLSASQLRIVRLLEAFCLERSSGSEYRAPSRAADLQRALEAVRQGRPGEADHLAVAWPDLRQFMTRHGLLAPAPAHA